MTSTLQLSPTRSSSSRTTTHVVASCPSASGGGGTSACLGHIKVPSSQIAAGHLSWVQSQKHTTSARRQEQPMTASLTTNTAAGTSLPLAPGRWTLDPHHSGVFFMVHHICFANVPHL